jgi:hypothetical protein
MDDNTIDKPLHLVLREDGKAIEREIIDSRGIHHIIKVEFPDKQYVLSNGAIYETGRKIIKGPPNGGTLGIRDVVGLRQERYEAAERAACKAIISKSPTKNIMGGWQTIIASQVNLALEENAYSTRAAEFVGKAAGLLRSERDNTPIQAVGSGVSLITDDLARAIAEAIRYKRENKGNE